MVVEVNVHSNNKTQLEKTRIQFSQRDYRSGSHQFPSSVSSITVKINVYVTLSFIYGWLVNIENSLCDVPFITIDSKVYNKQL